MTNRQLYCGDCLDLLGGMTANSVDSIITDPPYALEFMGKGWDKVLPPVKVWAECLRVAKPGAMLLAFGGTRTFHRLTCAIEDAGWEIRDCVTWLYGSGFPKSHDISKGIDKTAGAERERTGRILSVTGNRKHGSNALHPSTGLGAANVGEQIHEETIPATGAAKLWHGWGTALKPAWEPIVLAMKPLDGTFAQNALGHGVAGLWIDGGRIPLQDRENTSVPLHTKEGHRGSGGWKNTSPAGTGSVTSDWRKGRWPANVIHDGSEEVLDGFPQTVSGCLGPGHTDRGKVTGTFGAYGGGRIEREFGNDSGSASRFFYCAKASRAERNAGLEGMLATFAPTMSDGIGCKPHNPETATKKQNCHPTVKPLKLIEYLCKLTRTPSGGTVLDPFMGSGTTGVACMRTDRAFIGAEIDPDYFKIAKQRIEAAAKMPRQLGLIGAGRDDKPGPC